MTNINDIARLAGVAKSTVSRYLNGGVVGEETRLKLDNIIKETGYTPNAFAQSLKAKRTNIVGAIVPRLDSFAASQILIGIDEELRAENYQLLISNTSQTIEREIESIYTLAKQKAAGIILLATEVTPAHLEAFKKINIPVILMGQQADNIHSVIHDDYGAAYEMGKYILSKGHKKVAYLGVTERDISVGIKRKEGFKKAMEEHGSCEVRYYETGFKLEAALAKASEVIETYRPSIIVCATDNIAMGTLKAANLLKVKVPTELSITGFGGYEVTTIIHPTLTTVKLYFKEAGQHAAKGIMKLIKEEIIPPVTVSKFKIIEGESVDRK
ncbi:LacI family DNA-binding transcriptional regulator [Alloiococcus sp. CFN-8]|uniref:LacI family DNA-binding transcriptional regulator n=1 Tax=Alloiococcus sp. CFN-8 TaxID=3416081 RepID=UPI003CF494F7